MDYGDYYWGLYGDHCRDPTKHQTGEAGSAQGGREETAVIATRSSSSPGPTGRMTKGEYQGVVTRLKEYVMAPDMVLL